MIRLKRWSKIAIVIIVEMVLVLEIEQWKHSGIIGNFAEGALLIGSTSLVGVIGDCWVSKTKLST